LREETAAVVSIARLQHASGIWQMRNSPLGLAARQPDCDDCSEPEQLLMLTSVVWWWIYFSSLLCLSLSIQTEHHIVCVWLIRKKWVRVPHTSAVLPFFLSVDSLAARVAVNILQAFGDAARHLIVWVRVFMGWSGPEGTTMPWSLELGLTGLLVWSRYWKLPS